MTPIKGKLDPFFETGTEGIIWSVYENGKEGYDGLNHLNEGDYLTIFHPDDHGIIIWEGNINLEYKRNYRPYPMNPQYGQQEIHGFWVHGVQRDVLPETWSLWFLKEYPAELIKGEIDHLYRCESSVISGYQWKGHGSPFNTIRDSADMILKFNTGDLYRYKNVDYDTAQGFSESESYGKFFYDNIKDKFVVEKITLPKPLK